MREHGIINATGNVFDDALTPPVAGRVLARFQERGAGFAPLVRAERAVELLCALTGAEDASVWNNSIGALWTCVAAFAGRSVVVSRAHLIELESGARVASLIAGAGARLVEVGAANRTRASDYEQGKDAAPGAIVAVHPSEVEYAELAAMARATACLLVVYVPGGELSAVRQALHAGAGLVAFPADRAFGGPDAGIVAGTRSGLESLRCAPCGQAFELDVLRHSMLTDTLELWAAGEEASIPIVRMREESLEAVGVRASMLAACLGDGACVARLDEVMGKPSVGVVLRHPDPEGLAQALDAGTPRVIARATSDAVLFDARTLADRDVMLLAEAVRSALSEHPSRRLALVPTSHAMEREEPRDANPFDRR